MKTQETDVKYISAYRRQMGAEYEKLHPEIQKRFDFSTSNQIAFIGRGRMEKIWNGNKVAVFVLKLLSKSSILFPRTGENIEYEIHNYPYIDSFGREVHSLNRVFFFPDEEQRFDGTATYSESKKRIVEYLGLDHRMLFEMDLAEENGAIRFYSGRQFMFLGKLKIPVPSLFRGNIDLIEWFDEPTQRFYLDLKVKSPIFGPLFGFSGWFEAEYLEFKDKTVPEKFRPAREEAKE